MTFPLSAPMFDMLVLSVIAEEDAYGYQISQIIKRASSSTKDSTLYPILKRLQENLCVEAYDQPFQGRNRKYYTITDAGRQYLTELMDEWSRYRSIVDDIIRGGTDK
ncbi:PadR family transcriptional regulator [Mediterraneibacter agrestimuris]|uniref:PadR family transcriptional regulator n=1 Tax=Mediterraneibacter agrestimuris TaxID=2941333 RepID=UPI00203FC77D|nr:PadR family transcriptional regulator [Mediterraneibacter agrestimuris]